MRHQSAVFVMSLLFLAAFFFACSASNNTTDSNFFDDEYSSEYDESSSSGKTSNDSTSSSSGKVSSSAESSSSSITSSSSSGTANSKTSALLDSIYDSKSGKTYKTVQIGSYAWLVENVSYKTSLSKCYEDRLENCETFGRLYKAYSDSLCPTGFELPNKEAWDALIKTAGSTQYLKSSRYWQKSDDVERANDSLGLSLLPGGLCKDDKCAKLNKYAYYAIKDSSSAVCEVAYDNDSLVIKSKTDFADSIYVSVRCVKPSASVQKTTELPKSCSDGDSTYVIAEKVSYKCKYSQWHKVRDTRPDSCNRELATTIYGNAVYVCKSDLWRKASSRDFEIGFCNKENDGESFDLFGKIYVCDSLNWRNQNIEEAYGVCKNKYATEIVKFDDNKYVCEKEKWRRTIYPEDKVGICTTEMSGDTIVQFTGQAASGGGIDIAYFYVVFYVCKDRMWQTTDDDNDILGVCNSSRNGEVVLKPCVATDASTCSRYACENGKWRSATVIERYAGVCTSKIQDSVTLAAGQHLYCDKGSWRMATPEEFYGACTKALQDEFYDDSVKYVCDNLAWRKLDPPPTGTSAYCTSKNEGDKFSRKASSTTLYYYCHNYKWTPVLELEYRIGICDKDNVGKRVSPSPDSSSYECTSSNGNYYWKQLNIEEEFGIKCDKDYQDTVRLNQVCAEGAWRQLSSLEKSIGPCTNTLIGKMTQKSSSYYECRANGWNSVTKDYYELGKCTDEKDDYAGRANNIIYFCEKGSWTKADEITDTSKCYSYEQNTYAAYKGNVYRCDARTDRQKLQWEFEGDITIKHGLCTNARLYKSVAYNDSFYVCMWRGWQVANLEEALESFSGNEANVYGQKYVRSGDSWAPVYGTMTDSRDKKSYRTILLEGMTFMVDNLNYASSGSKCYLDADRYCGDDYGYGRFYTWNEAQKACPTGWHLPSYAEYKKIVGSKLSLYIIDPKTWQLNEQPTNFISGLEYKGTGIYYNGTFNYEKLYTAVWISDEDDNANGYVDCRSTQNPCSNIFGTSTVPTSYDASSRPTVYVNAKDNYANVRCIKDK